jgi:hypothetical protein
MKRFARFAFLTVLILTAFAPIAARGQDVARLESLEVAIWPEYDRPGALVIYLARASAGLEPPVMFELPIPAALGDPHAVAAWYPDGQLDDQITWTRSVDGEWATISAEVETTGLWIEYYAPLETEGSNTSFTYQWPGGVQVDSFRYEVMHPLGSTEMQVTPAGETSVDPDGMTYTRSQLGAFDVGDSRSIEVRYSNPSRPPLQPAAPYPGNLPLLGLDIGLWPEYDQPDTLVILRVSLDPATALPARVALPIPSDVGDPFAVAQQDSNGQLFVAPYERELIGDWAWIVVETDSSAFQVEYYTPLTLQGQQRSFTYFWPGGVDLGQLSYEVQHPVGAQGTQVLPPGTTALDDDELFYTRATMGPREASEGALVAFAYTKQDEVLTVDAPTPSIDRPATTTGGTPDLTTLLPIALAIFGGLLVLAGVFLFVRFRQEDQQPKARRRRRTRRDASDEIDASPVFCHVCGTQAGPSDRFCRHCGTELRK